jgi:hypothetical protein
MTCYLKTKLNCARAELARDGQLSRKHLLLATIMALTTSQWMQVQGRCKNKERAQM